MAYRQEAITPYDGSGKAQQVEAMFDHIAPTYDILNHRLSWNIDKWWRRRAIRLLVPHQPKTLLDVATGTGDFALLANRMLPEVRITGIDISEGMMQVGRQKVLRQGLQDSIRFERQDAGHMTYADNTFDAVTATFGIRNFASLDAGLREMCRVLKPGGQLCLLELTTPPSGLMRHLFRLYAHTVLPAYGRMVSKDAAAYSYLIKTIEAFPQGEQMTSILQAAGFRAPGFRRLTFGICTLYFATK